MTITSSSKQSHINRRRAKRDALPRRGFVAPVTICGKTYKIIFDKKNSGGSFSLQRQEIRIGMYHTPERAHDILVHEVLEIIMVELRYRFIYPCGGDTENGDMRFMLTHDDFEKVADELAYVLRQTNNLRRRNNEHKLA